MKRKKLRFGMGFRVAMGNRRSQAAEMVIAPGDSEGGPENRHHGADQWLYVISGRGVVRSGSRSYPLSAGVLLLIERRNKHEVKNTGTAPLRTLNFYSPPAYRKDGSERPAARP
jgi:mannose-6-phosphate isomerase-like protein (cupin superfamily)